MHDADGFAHDGAQWVASTAGSYATSSDGVAWTHHDASNVPAQLLFADGLWIGRQNGEVRSGQTLDALAHAASSVPDFRAWTAGAVLDANVPVTGVPACADNR